MSRIMMWANMRRGPSISVPSPYDGDSTIPWWYDKISMLAEGWAARGMTDVLFPNPLKTNAGAFPGADGYGAYDDHDIGSKNTMQFGGTPTRFGYAEQLRRAVAICHANGMDVLIDHVMHQRSGGRNCYYEYLGADGHTKNGRFAKTPGCFLGDPPRRPRDPIAGPIEDDFAFGDQLCPINAVPPDYVAQGLINAGDWLFRTLDANGARLDCMKGMNSGFIHRFVTSKAMKDKWFFGEYADGNPNTLNWWVGDVGNTCSATDFAFHYNMAMAMCNDAGGGKFEMRWLHGRGMMFSNPMKAVPFVESMDSDTNGFATIVNNKILAYALMLAGEGLPTIYIRDYLREPDCYGLGGNIDNLCWINRNLAEGGTVMRFGDAKNYIFERTGGPKMIMALNNSVWDPSWHYINIQTGFGPNVQLHDYTGHNENDTWTDHNGRATIAIPPGANGLGYCCWSRAGLSAKIPVKGRSTTQTFFGAVDLDIGPAVNDVLQVGRIWVAKGSPIEVTLTPDKTGWSAQSVLRWQIIDPDNNITKGSAAPVVAKADGWHVLDVIGANLPAGGSPYEFKVTYTAPKKFTQPAVSHTARREMPDEALAAEIAEMSAKNAEIRMRRNARELSEEV